MHASGKIARGKNGNADASLRRFMRVWSRAAKAVKGYRSPRRFASGIALDRPARVLECASPSSDAKAMEDWLALCLRAPNGQYGDLGRRNGTDLPLTRLRRSLIEPATQGVRTR